MSNHDCAYGHAAENGHCPGITKHEYFVGIALQGILATFDANNPNWSPNQENVEYATKLAFTTADAVMTELNTLTPEQEAEIDRVISLL